jgi:hypothetical protein
MESGSGQCCRLKELIFVIYHPDPAVLAAAGCAAPVRPCCTCSSWLCSPSQTLLYLQQLVVQPQSDDDCEMMIVMMGS